MKYRWTKEREAQDLKQRHVIRVCRDGIKRNSLRPLTDKEFSKRFWERIDIKGRNDCWIWHGCIVGSLSKYGGVSYKGRMTKAHRLAWQLTFKRKIPKGKLACHKCDNKLCCNPYHIFIGTQRDNMLDMFRKGRGNRTPMRGDKNHRTKITKEQASEIKRLRYKMALPLSEISLRVKVSKTTVSSICSGRSWRWVGRYTIYPIIPKFLSKSGDKKLKLRNSSSTKAEISTNQYSPQYRAQAL
jgi:HNH endonuclease